MVDVSNGITRSATERNSTYKRTHSVFHLFAISKDIQYLNGKMQGIQSEKIMDKTDARTACNHIHSGLYQQNLYILYHRARFRNLQNR